MIFLSYYIIAIAVNIDRIEKFIDPIDTLRLKKVESVYHLYFGTFAHKEDLEQLKITKVISILNPSIPFSKELINYQRDICKELHIDFMNISVTAFNHSTTTILSIINDDANKDQVIYINGYFFSQKLERLKRSIVMQHKPLK